MRSDEMTICLFAPWRDVGDQQHVDLAVLAAQAGHRVRADRVDVLVHEGLGGDVPHHVVLVVVVHIVPDGVQQVGLAEARRAVDEQWVVRAGRSLGHPKRCRECELVGGALHEGLERVPGVEAGDVDRCVPRGVTVLVALRTAVAGAVARPGRRLRDLRVADRLGRADGDVEPPVALAEFGEGVRDQRLVAREDPIAGQRARYLDDEVVVAVVDDRHDLGEGGEPHRLGELGAEQLRYRCPHLLLIAHSTLRDPTVPCADDDQALACTPRWSLERRWASTRLSTGVDKSHGARQAQHRSTFVTCSKTCL
jgi:hypothetical protein